MPQSISNLYKFILFFFILCINMYIVSCSDDETEDYHHTTSYFSDFPKDSHVRFVCEEPDIEGLYYNGSWVMAWENELDGEYVYIIGDEYFDQPEMLLITDLEGNLVKIGHQNELATVTFDANTSTLALMGYSGSKGMWLCSSKISTTQPHSVSSRTGTAKNSLTQKGANSNRKNILDTFGKFAIGQNSEILERAIDIYDKCQQTHDGEWMKLSTGTLAAGVTKAVGSSNPFSISVSLGIASWDYSATQWKSMVYGYAKPKITNIEMREDGGFQVNVCIEDASSLPSEINYMVGNRTGDMTIKSKPNRVYCGVMTAIGYPPTYSRHNAVSGEMEVNSKMADSKGHINLRFVIYPEIGNCSTFICAYLIAEESLPASTTSFKVDALLRSEPQTLLYADITMDVSLLDMSCYNWSPNLDECSVQARVKVSAKNNSADYITLSDEVYGLKDWGVEFRVGDDGEFLGQISMFEDESFGTINNMSQGEMYPYLYIDGNNFTIYSNYAELEDGLKVTPYVTVYNSYYLDSEKTYYGIPKRVIAKYDKSPEIRFSSPGTTLVTNTLDPHLAVRPLTLDYGRLNIMNEATVCLFCNGSLMFEDVKFIKEGSGWNKSTFLSVHNFLRDDPLQTEDWWMIHAGYVEDWFYEDISFTFWWSSLSENEYNPSAGSRKFFIEATTRDGRIVKSNKCQWLPVYKQDTDGKIYLSHYDLNVM